MPKRKPPKPHGIAWLNPPGKIGVSWNPVVGCTPVSAGCANCYAARDHHKRQHANWVKVAKPKQYEKPFSEVQLMPDRLSVPLSWRKPRSVFVCSE